MDSCNSYHYLPVLVPPLLSLPVILPLTTTANTTTITTTTANTTTFNYKTRTVMKIELEGFPQS